jgi:AcrR family transcriptional regulator
MRQAGAAVKPEQEVQSLLPPRASADGTHRRLQEVALALFAERGFHGVSVRDIAASAGIQPSSMYAHLASKEQLLFELVALGHQEHNACVRAAAQASGPSPAQQIEALVIAHVTFHGDYPLLGQVCNRELHALSGARLQEVMVVRHDTERIIEGTIKRGIESGAFKVDDSFLAVAAIGAMGIRMAEWWPDQSGYSREKEGYSLEDVAVTYAGFALSILGARRRRN